LSLPGSFQNRFHAVGSTISNRDRTQRDGRFDRADCAPVFKTRRRALLRHRLGAFNQRADGFMLLDKVPDRCDIDALFGIGNDDRNIDALHQHRGGPVGNLNDS